MEMRLIKAIFRQTVDVIFFIVTLIMFLAYIIKDWNDSSFWLAACALYVLGNIFNKARLSIWLENNNLKP